MTRPNQNKLSVKINSRSFKHVDHHYFINPSTFVSTFKFQNEINHGVLQGSNLLILAFIQENFIAQKL